MYAIEFFLPDCLPVEALPFWCPLRVPTLCFCFLSVFQAVVDDPVCFFCAVEQFVAALCGFDTSDYDFRRVENGHGFLSCKFRPLVLDDGERDPAVGVELSALSLVLVFAHVVGCDIG